MMSVWWNIDGIVHYELVPDAVNADLYSEQLSQVYEVLKTRYSALINQKKVLLQHDNAPAHRARLTTNRIKYLGGRQNVHDDERSGRPVTATDNAAVASVRNVVEADRRVTIDGIMIRLPPGREFGRSSIGTIMSNVLNFRKVCARWVPRLLSENHKQQRMEAARAFLEMHRRDGDQLFYRIVTGDESWVHHSTPETKRQSMVWKKPEESAPKKAKVTISAGKVMAIVFWDCKGVLLVDYLPPNITVNAARYCEVLNELRSPINGNVLDFCLG
ncbi:hypothetical protein LAZ67_3000042 [Cordylochernes scorpioides]|uniref:Transposase n=1 Tax=Cordylochernes scorpioides TaxID=51811 RepID=A0ABY6K8T7_9ARAC|nr:hypothetical protein LAZ67_3000042 [Cordylochernes scorpioides]